ncbi:hypothetical protein ACOJQI_10945 [Bacillus salacetis]|uniref:hypothetical protein n=1 Tax=Bacillus salacetis TaxID=2315464 RepID=UPI003BA1DB9B
MQKLIVVLFFLLLTTMAVGCTNSNELKVEELSDDELLVKHWQDLSDERKFSLIEDIHREERFFTDYEGQKDTWIMLFDAGLRNTSYQENNLKKAMKEFNRDREITESSQ